MTLTNDFRKLLSTSCASVLNPSPAVVAAYESDFEGNLPAFADLAQQNRGLVVLLQIGFEHETPEPAAKLAAAVSRFREMSPESRVIVLCNCEGEVSALGGLGVETRLIHQNCFLDERRFRPMGGRNRPYDAAYIARLTPFKRHSLIPVEMAPRLLLLGTVAEHQKRTNRAYVEEMSARYAAARWVNFFHGVKVSELLALANCGLALSAAEGACFASAEYFLCGLPVVDTPALGGRAVLYPEEYACEVEADPEAIAAGVARWRAQRPDPWKVRRAWLEKAAPHRAAYRELMRELTGRDPGRPPHKLGIRTPHSSAFWSFAIQSYLLLKGFVR